jgi:hypothetical protein
MRCRWLRAAIDMAVNNLVVVPDVVMRWFDRKIYGPKDSGENTVFGLSLSVIQFSIETSRSYACPILIPVVFYNRVMS